MQRLLSEFVVYPTNSENCVGCRMCVDSCPSQALTSKINGNILKIFLDVERCYGCGVCADVCPFNVLELVKRDEIKEFRIEKDILRPERPEKKKFYGIVRRVFEKGLCCGCGACTVCPPRGILWNDGIVDFPDWVRLCRDCAICIKVCQRYNFQPKSGLGEYVEMVGARSKRFEGQDGGMVSEFLACALETGLVDTVLAVSRTEDWRPIVVHIKSPDQLKNGRIAGTKYSIAPVLPEVNRIIKRVDSLAIVGTPCIVTGLRTLQREIPLYEKVKFAVSLFCMENFRYSSLREFLEENGVDIRKAKRFDIKKGKFIVELEDGKFSCPVKDLEDHVSSGCHYCQDFTGVDGDVSVGSVGTPKGYSTVIIRSERAMMLYEYMRDKGYIEECDVKVDVVKKLCDYKVNKAEKNVPL